MRSSVKQQTFEEYEKTVPAFVPRGSISWLMGRVHVGTPDAEVEADIRGRLAGNPACTEEMLVKCIEYAIACHRENQGLYRAVVSGRL
jgi:hypothetical protein